MSCCSNSKSCHGFDSQGMGSIPQINETRVTERHVTSCKRVLLDPEEGELGHAVADAPDVLQRGAVNSDLVQARAPGVSQEVGRSGEDDVIGQNDGALAKQTAALQQLQVRQVTALPVIHEDQIQTLHAEVLTQTRDHFIRRTHDQLHLRSRSNRSDQRCPDTYTQKVTLRSNALQY